MNTNEYDVKIVNVVDGDTVDVDINLGFGVDSKMKESELWALTQKRAELETEWKTSSVKQPKPESKNSCPKEPSSSPQKTDTAKT